MLIVLLGVICNFIIYLAFGSLIIMPFKKRREGAACPLMLSVVTGFFFYYFVFFFVCVPPMQYYRPLSMLTGIWVPVVAVLVLLSAVLNGKQWIKWFKSALAYIGRNPAVTVLMALLLMIQVVLVSYTYNFTLDAAYYVANVATSVETNMMNVYDPFTGAWQDHYEMRYFFATYSMQDSVVCQLTGIPALIWTKSVMAITIILLTNMVYIMIARELIVYKNGRKAGVDADADDRKNGVGVASDDRKEIMGNPELATVIMAAIMFVVNLTFITIYTSSLFLMTRTYEGKAIVGNLAVMTLFYLFIRMNDESINVRPWLITFIVCFGAATISSSANMLLPVELTVLFIPMIVRKKKWNMLLKYAACVVPGIVFSLVFVLYVKGYFVLYTFPK
ncbi:MAG: hypothetical protein K6E63_06135 [Lachnospiraceae bacterium]|nr:hypothetical protein [Lachnospiraceae bacterium]